MSSTGKMVTWICMFSTLFMGCYTSALISPTGDKKEEMHTGTIEYVVLTDEAKFEFDSPPTIINNAIVGVARGDSISIPLSNVLLVNVTKVNAAATLTVWIFPVAILVIGLANMRMGHL